MAINNPNNNQEELTVLVMTTSTFLLVVMVPSVFYKRNVINKDLNWELRLHATFVTATIAFAFLSLTLVTVTLVTIGACVTFGGRRVVRRLHIIS